MAEFDPFDLKYEFKDFIGIYENAFTKEECEDAIELFEKFNELGFTHQRSLKYLRNDNSVEISDLSQHELSFSGMNCSKIIKSFHDRFYNYIYPIYNHQFPVLQNMEHHRCRYFKLQKTLPKEGYHVWHHEHAADFVGRDRILAWILYLNDIDDGGETEFLYQSLRITPKTGTFILFPAYFTHMHRGNPPLKKIKYVATGWVEFMPTHQLQGEAPFPNLSPFANKLDKSDQITQSKINYT